MTSRDRMLAAMRQQEPDKVPCSIYFNQNLVVPGYDLTSWQERVRLQMDLGTDPVVHVGVPCSPHPETRTRTWVENDGGSGEEILYKEYATPAGTLRMGVKHTPEWPFGNDIPWGDHTTSHLFEPLIKSPEDVDAFEYIWRPPTPEDAEKAREASAESVRFAQDRGLPVQSFAGHGLATLLFVMGAEHMVLFAMDHAEAFRRLAQIDSRANLERIRFSAGIGADFVKRFGGYEQTNFLSRDLFCDIVLPLLRQEVAVAHEAGLLIYYRVVTGMEPLLEDIASVGFDCIEGGEPHLSRCSLEMWHEAFAGKAASWTGISTPALLGGNDPEAVRREVRKCVDVFGKRGFILGVTNSIRRHFPWENTLAMIEEWKKLS